jgi:HNH endonuclease/NUMOD4 motif
MPDKNWRPVAGFPNYVVSRTGQVWSIPRNRALKQTRNRRGYLLVSLYRGGRAKSYLVHRLIASAWIGPIPDGYEVNHRNGKKNQNDVNNLEIVTPQQNREHALRYGLIRRGADNPRARLTESIVKSIRLRAAGGETIRRLAREFDVAEKTISLVINRKTWKHVA